jgi:hypothetical protein
MEANQATVETGAGPEPIKLRNVSRPAKRVIEEAKARVPVIDLADLLCGRQKMRKVGDRWVARCPLPNHEDKTASFVVYPDDRGWYCFGCLRGGDVVKLAQLAWGHDRADGAAANVLHEFGHEIPQRPPSWFRKQARQKSVRDLAEAAKVEHVRDLVYRLVWLPWLRRLPGETRRTAAEDAWAKSLAMARMLYEHGREA